MTWVKSAATIARDQVRAHAGGIDSTAVRAERALALGDANGAFQEGRHVIAEADDLLVTIPATAPLAAGVLARRLAAAGLMKR